MILESNGNLFQVIRTVTKSKLKSIDKELLKEYMEYKGGDHMLENPETFFITKRIIEVEFEEVNNDNGEE